MKQFYPQPTALTVNEIVAMTGAKPRDGARLDLRVCGIAALESAHPTDLVFMDGTKYLDRLAKTRAGVCLTSERFLAAIPAAMTVLCSTAPFRDFVTVARKLYPDSLRPRTAFDAEAVAPGAIIHPTAEIEDGANIDPGAVIGPRAAIGSGTVICANAVIGSGVQIGRDCSVGPGASVMHALIGDYVTLHGGCRIGQDGFRYHGTAKGHIKVPQLGRVIIQDNVEIGANTSIDRGGIGDTVIGEGSKIDNLVQIGHNCTIGRHCIIAAQCGLSGSVVMGDFAVLGGQVGVADHLMIGEGAMVAAKSGVIADIPAGEKWLGYPAMRGREYLRPFVTSRTRVRREP